MSEAEKFIGRYEQDILSRVYLPKAIKERCRLTACLKAEDDREVYLVKGMDERKMILKTGFEREYHSEGDPWKSFFNCGYLHSLYYGKPPVIHRRCIIGKRKHPDSAIIL